MKVQCGIRQLQTFLVAATCAAVGLLGSVPSLATEPSPTPLDGEFLKLPAYDLERVGGPEQLQVGDSLVFRVAGLTQANLNELRLESPPGSENLTDQGWEINVEDTGLTPPGEFRVRAVPLKAGKTTLPSLAIIRGQGGTDATIPALARTNPITLEVSSAIKANDPKPDQPAELRPPVSLRFPWWTVVLGGVLALALVVGGWISYRRWRGRNAKAVVAKPDEPPKPEDEVALAALAELERNGPLRRGEFKAHYFRVSEILKAYIGARYNFDASESTTREMIGQLEAQHVLEDARLDRLETLFEKMDLVKFTDHVPIPDEGQMITESAREFVRATRRPPLVVGPTAGTPPVSGNGLSMNGTMR